jgi:hypothetical protein
MTATLARPMDAVKCPPYSLNTQQVAELTLVPLHRIYQLRKHLSCTHYSETRNANNCKVLQFTAPGVNQLELSHWLAFGRKSGWSETRLKAFRVASEWMEVNGYV